MTHFTVIMPTFDHGPIIKYAIESVLEQSETDWELFIIGDGAGEETRKLVADYSRRDARIHFFDNPKGKRHGELHRHSALKEARGKYVCYISDDDLWLPQHLRTMKELLSEADFAHSLPLRMNPEQDSVYVYHGSLSIPECRDRMAAGINFIPLSTAGHTVKSYQKLPYGWRVTPKGVSTDLYMWQQFLASNTEMKSGTLPTVLTFPDALRKGWDAGKRMRELEKWSLKIRAPEFAATLFGMTAAFLVQERFLLAEEFEKSRFQIQEEMRIRVEENQKMVSALQVEKAVSARLEEVIRELSRELREEKE